ncbi:hypothetical protein HAHE_14100 [Haloferula helveola]|uniref:Uncharacterized protein n=1 Tax=Haloferula helveola TaxID=490095 RepID=A0ABN6H1L1_9BACT|nr:hypothetical protein HAHE_14100 [Haloferula helveola]
MHIISTFLSVGILWFLITLFTRSTNASQSLTETWIVIIGMLIVGFISRLLLSGVLGPFTVIIDIAALYLLVDKVCGASRGVTIRICAWYFGLSFLISIFFAMLSR